MIFRNGDKVICVDNGIHRDFKKGSVYTVFKSVGEMNGRFMITGVTSGMVEATLLVNPLNNNENTLSSYYINHEAVNRYFRKVDKRITIPRWL